MPLYPEDIERDRIGPYITNKDVAETPLLEVQTYFAMLATQMVLEEWPGAEDLMDDLDPDDEVYDTEDLYVVALPIYRCLMDIYAPGLPYAGTGRPIDPKGRA